MIKKDYRECLNCGEKFKSYICNNRKFCSLKCAYAVRNPKVELICKGCGISFKVKYCNRNQIYCSNECYHKNMVTWNIGLTKETDSRIKTTSGCFKVGHDPWNKDLRAIEDERVANQVRGLISFKKDDESKEKRKEVVEIARNTLIKRYKSGEVVNHNKGKTKENYEPLLRAGEKNKLIKRTNEWKENMKKSHWSKNKKIRQEILDKMHTPEANKKRFENLINSYQHDIYNRDPTDFEQRVSQVCMNYKLPFIYTGNGAFWIAYGNLHKNPDLICEEKHIAIEVFHSFYKIRQYGSVKKYKDYCNKIYSERGWKVIFIDEEIMYNDNWENLCFQKIFEVMKQNE